MSQRILFLLISIWLLPHYFGQNTLSTGARSLSLSGATVATGDVWSFFTNPAATVKVLRPTFSVCYENKFLLAAFQQQALVGAIPIRKGIVQFGLKFDGSTLFRNDMFGVAYGLRLSDKISVGTSMRLQQLRIQNYGSQLQLFSDIGLYLDMSEKLKIGLSVLGLGSHQDLDKIIVFPTILKSGISYQPSPKLMLLGEFEKALLQPLSFKGGIEYKTNESFLLRVGMNSRQKSLSTGIGYVLKTKLSIELGTNWQQLFGWSPHAGIVYSFIDSDGN
jgi:hypothetical protein